MILDIVIVLICYKVRYKMRYKLIFLTVVLAVLGTGCSSEIKKKKFTDQNSSQDVCAADATRANQYFCLSSALTTDCANHPEQCGQEKFLKDGYGGFVYPQPLVTFFNNMYSQYVNQYYNANNILPPYVHFGEYFGLLYNETLPDKDAKPSDVNPDLSPVGIVSGGTVVSTTATNGIAYDSESCALCHFGITNDGFYRFGVANTQLKYGGLKLAFNRFVCYAEAYPGTEYEGLDTKCAVTDLTKLSATDQEECKTYTAFKMSTGNAAMLTIWKTDSLISPDMRTQLLTALKESVQPVAATACEAVGQMLPAYNHTQVTDLSNWEGVHYPDGTIIESDSSRMDRFYHSVTIADGSFRNISDGVHAPVKIPLLGNLISADAAAQGDYSGPFLGSGMVTSLQQYVRMHAALVGGSIEAAPDDATLAPLMQFIAGLELPKPDTSATTLQSGAYKTGSDLFGQRCAGCHDESHQLVDYVTTVGTDFSYATALVAADVYPRSVPENIAKLTPIDTWNATLPPQSVSALKQPRMQGLWASHSFLHNGMAYSLSNLFCINTGYALPLRVAKDSTSGLPIFSAPFFDSGHEEQTCASDLTIEQRQDIITYILTL